MPTKKQSLDALYEELRDIEEEIDELNNLLMDALQDRAKAQARIDDIENNRG